MDCPLLGGPACSPHAALPGTDRAAVTLLQHMCVAQSMLREVVDRQAKAGRSSSSSSSSSSTCSLKPQPSALKPHMLQERQKRNRSLRLSSLEPMGARSRRELQQLCLQGPEGPSRGTSLFWESSAQDRSGLHPLLVRPCCRAQVA